jgi:hypothetical protein
MGATDKDFVLTADFDVDPMEKNAIACKDVLNLVAKSGDRAAAALVKLGSIADATSASLGKIAGSASGAATAIQGVASSSQQVGKGAAAAKAVGNAWDEAAFQAQFAKVKITDATEAAAKAPGGSGAGAISTVRGSGLASDPGAFLESEAARTPASPTAQRAARASEREEAKKAAAARREAALAERRAQKEGVAAAKERAREEARAAREAEQAAKSQERIQANLLNTAMGRSTRFAGLFGTAVFAVHQMVSYAQELIRDTKAVTRTAAATGSGFSGAMTLKNFFASAGVDNPQQASGSTLEAIAKARADALAGDEKMASAFAQMGVNADKLRDSRPDQIYKAISYALEHATENAEDYARAVHLIGEENVRASVMTLGARTRNGTTLGDEFRNYRGSGYTTSLGMPMAWLESLGLSPGRYNRQSTQTADQAEQAHKLSKDNDEKAWRYSLERLGFEQKINELMVRRNNLVAQEGATANKVTREELRGQVIELDEEIQRAKQEHTNAILNARRAPLNDAYALQRLGLYVGGRPDQNNQVMQQQLAELKTLVRGTHELIRATQDLPKKIATGL